MTDFFPVPAVDGGAEFGPTMGIEPEDDPIAVPCTIHCDFPPPLGSMFVVKDIGAWQHTDEGIFASGHFLLQNGTSPKHRDILIPYAKINYIDFDFEALTTFRDEEDPND